MRVVAVGRRSSLCVLDDRPHRRVYRRPAEGGPFTASDAEVADDVGVERITGLGCVDVESGRGFEVVDEENGSPLPHHMSDAIARGRDLNPETYERPLGDIFHTSHLGP